MIIFLTFVPAIFHLSFYNKFCTASCFQCPFSPFPGQYSCMGFRCF
jgi:hypothetical protein